MNYKQIIAGYWASPIGFISLVYLIGNSRFGMNIDFYLYVKSAMWAIIPISLPISLYEAYKYKNSKNQT